jgi:hypothetical protein
VASGSNFAGQNIVTLETGTRSGTYRVGYSLRYGIDGGVNAFFYRVADTTSTPQGVALAEMIEHQHSQNVQPDDNFHSSGFFKIQLNGVNKKLTLQCRAGNSGTNARITYEDARLEIWKVG